jgi:hypothetical protein
MPANQTEIIRSLTQEEQHNICTELAQIDSSVWIKHVLPYQKNLTALYEGLTIHLNWSNPLIPTRPELFPNTMNIIDNVLNGGLLGRAYIHKILPKCKIRLHNDLIHAKKMNIVRRYQIYLEIPSPVTLILDNQIVANPNDYQNSLVDFALCLPHAYENHSDQDWVFVVFDEILP